MKKFIETIYGMQYEELVQQSKDGNKARLNGNLFLAAFIIIILFIIILAINQVNEYNQSMTEAIRSVVGNSSGKSIGKLLAIPLMGIIYFILIKTIGSESAFKKHVASYSQYSTEEKKKSAIRVLGPFFGLLGLLLLLALI